MRFRYPMQKLVDLKTNEKEQAEWMLSEAICDLNREELSLSELLSEQQRVRTELEEASVRKTTVSQIQMLQHYLQHLEQRVRSQRNEVGRAQDRVSDNRMKLEEKMKEEKVWTKAKEKAQQQFQAFVLKKEQDELDEMALVRRVQMI